MIILSVTYLVVRKYQVTTQQTSNNLMRDCTWRINTYSWIDSNNNKALDNDEKPLEGVAYYVIEFPIYHRYGWGSYAISNSEGKATFDIIQAACPDIDAVVLAVPPKGYKPTTSDMIYFTSNDELWWKEFKYGFIAE
jgi:hypothetical protein